MVDIEATREAGMASRHYMGVKAMGRRTWTTILGMAMVIASCGGGGAGSGTTEGDTGTTAEADNGGDTSSDETTTTLPEDTDTGDSDSREFPFETGEGFFTVDGERFDVQVIRCIPDEPGEGHLELFLYANQTNGLDVSLTSETMMASTEHEYETNRFRASLVLGTDAVEMGFESPPLATDPEGDWFDAHPNELALGGSEEFDPLEEPPLVIEGAAVSGTVQVEQNFPEGETGTPVITYDLTLPGEEVDCDAF